MLQVITGRYFRDVPLHETTHRRTLYSNASFLGVDRIDLPFGFLTPSTDLAPIATLSVECVEKIEAVRPDGTDEFMISTGGDAILADLAVVLSFVLDVTVTPTRALADRLIKSPNGSHHEPEPSDILPRTFTPNVIVQADEVRMLLRFLDQLLTLERGAYEAAMRTMRRIVVASNRVAEDPTLSYIDFVAALEALSRDFTPSDITWERVESRKRKILNPVLGTLDDADAAAVRAAIMEGERAGIKYRYTEFVLDHIQPSFFREEVERATRPIPRTSLRRAVTHAYDSRSRSLHELRELEAGTWLLVGGAHTVTPPTGPLMLTHAGLNHLSRHVTRTFVERASRPTVECAPYAWRDHLPNVIRARLSSEFYLGNAEAMTPRTAPQRASEFLSHLIEVMSGRHAEFKVDMRPALARIEELLKTEKRTAARVPMLAIYWLWHRFMHPDLHMPDPNHLMASAQQELGGSDLFSFALSLLARADLDLDLDEWCELAETREQQRLAARFLELPTRLDAALWVRVAMELDRDGAQAHALAALEKAVEAAPGLMELVALERGYADGGPIQTNLTTFLLGPSAARDDTDGGSNEGDEEPR